ncbi:elongation factor P-like protein YeiP [bacterium]|nr:elongation factor P-like protein YeiP [bacterium]
MPKANQLKRNQIVKIKNELYQVVNVASQTPSARGAATLYKVRFNHVQTRQKLDQTYKGDDVVEDADLMRMKVQFLYFDGENYVFMQNDDFSQHNMTEDQLTNQTQWLYEGMDDIDGLFLDGILFGINLPHTIVLEITETAPSMKGASATARTKSATLSTGAEVQVPEYLSTGEKIKINTEAGEYISRA